MSYFNQIAIKTADSPSIDAFSRWRTSTPYTIFDSKQLYDTGSFVWSTKTVGNATASFYTNNASVVLYASGSNSSVTRQTKRRFNYQPGKSQLTICTGNFSGSVDGVIKRIGYFDQNDGVYFVTSGSSCGVGIRSYTTGVPTDTFISQSSWNLDKFDGTGVSGRTLNWTASQIFFTDFEWLGVGRVRYGIFQGGNAYYVHEISHTNALPTVYMSNPNLPVRYELIASGSTSSSMLHVCSTVVSEGGVEQNGSIRCAAQSTTGVGINAGQYGGVIAIRLKSADVNSSVIPLAVSTATSTNSTYEATLLLNPSGSLNWSWQDLPNSNVQYATASALLSITNEGTKLQSQMVNAGNVGNLQPDQVFALGSDLDGNLDVLVVGMKVLVTNAGNTFASLIWRESI